MRKNTCPSLAVLLGGLTLFVAAHAARADFLPSYTCCPTAVTVCRKSSPGVKFISAAKPVSPSCAVRYYATCWRDCAAPDYSHCRTLGCGSSIPISLPLVPTPHHLPLPSKDKGDELPKPRVDEKPQPKPEAKPKAEANPQAMNIIYHPSDESAFSSQLWRPIATTGR